MEGGVEEEDNVMFDGHTVEKYGHSRILLILISLIPPLSDKFTVEDENVEGVKEEDNIVFDGHTVEKYRRSNILLILISLILPLSDKFTVEDENVE